MSKKVSRLGSDPLDWIKDTSNEDTIMPDKQHTGKTIKQQANKPAVERPVKATYYIKKPELIKRLKQIGLDQDRDLSDLVTEAIEDMIKKYTSKTA